MNREGDLVSMRLDSVQGWIVTCAACGKLAALSATRAGYWRAVYISRGHEEVHAGEEEPGPRR